MSARAQQYWEDDNGGITCVAHAGNYLRSAIERDPLARTARSHRTPLGTYRRMTKTEVADFQEFLAVECNIITESICEQCIEIAHREVAS